MKEKTNNYFDPVMVFLAILMVMISIFYPYDGLYRHWEAERQLIDGFMESGIWDSINWFGMNDSVREVTKIVKDESWMVGTPLEILPSRESYYELLKDPELASYLFLERLGNRMYVIFLSLSFFFWMGFALFGFSYCQREMRKTQFTFTSPFLLRMHVFMNKVSFSGLLILFVCPFCVRPELLFLLCGLWVFFQSTMIALIQKKI
ncbi:MAG: hypothetical protein IKC44_03170 [Burkholderiaceae bacterium]|nr:hypothetical protein [Burkholderiaceae bacterium]